MRFLKNLLCVLILSFTGVNVAAQQITGSIRGGISDPSGAVVQDATVTAKQMETGLIRTVSSAKDGSFLLVELPVGHYSLEVAARGFQKYGQEGISLNVNETATVPVRLTVGAETQKVVQGQFAADFELWAAVRSAVPVHRNA